MKIQQALISVADKRNLNVLASALRTFEINVLASGGSAEALSALGVAVRAVSEYTGYPALLDGRVKTLHPKIHAGLLAVRDRPEHMREIENAGVDPIDLVVCNLYPFESTVAREGITLVDAIEQIDIGGVALLRAAAKNFESVAVVCDPEDYTAVTAELEEKGGELLRATRLRLAQKAFARTAAYDSAIYRYLCRDDRFPPFFPFSAEKLTDLRYGENPHQGAALYRFPEMQGGIAAAFCHQGKGLSYTNLLDFDTAWNLVEEFDAPSAVVVKHANPCGVATGKDLQDAYAKAKATDPTSAFGSVIGLNRRVEVACAREIIATFVEGVVAPDFSAAALDIFKQKQDLRVLASEPLGDGMGLEFRSLSGGLVLQERDASERSPENLRVVTERAPTPDEAAGLRFAWTVVKGVKSNAIVLARADETIAIGAGQMSRVDAVRLAVMKAEKLLKGSVLASDAFFPFRDGIDVAAEAGATAVIQPGGSIRDNEVIQAANEHGMAMIFTGVRHFRH